MPKNEEFSSRDVAQKKPRMDMRIWALRKLFRVVLTAVLLLLLFNAGAVQNVLGKLPSNAITDKINGISERWTTYMDKRGPAQVHTLMEEITDALKDVQR